MGVRRGIDREKVGCRSLIDANLEGQVGVNKFKLYRPCEPVEGVHPVLHALFVVQGLRGGGAEVKGHVRAVILRPLIYQSHIHLQQM